MPFEFTGLIIGLGLIFIVLLILALNIKIVPQATVFVIERLGTYYATWETGLHFKIPFFDRIAKRVSIKEQVVDFKPQPVITKDNVTMQIDTVVFYQITDANFSATVLKDLFLQLKTLPQQHFVTSSASLNSTALLPAVMLST